MGFNKKVSVLFSDSWFAVLRKEDPNRSNSFSSLQSSSLSEPDAPITNYATNLQTSSRDEKQATEVW